mmetsp:Transcript_26610/g.35599  ORF Transcript_26610/g.35599 Transcript_26610/m.35599 type:complete len:114 (+) Transcript_26610:150-491(+)
MNESEKITLEVLDEVFSSAIPDLHILHPVPLTCTVAKVVLDENKILVNYAEATRNMRSASVASHADSNEHSFKRGLLAPPFLDTASRKSAASGEGRSISVSPKQKKAKLLSTP